MYECAYCEAITDGENSIRLGVNPDKTVYMHDADVMLCDECNQKLEDGIEEEEIKEAGREKVKQKAIKEEKAEGLIED